MASRDSVGTLCVAALTLLFEHYEEQDTMPVLRCLQIAAKDDPELQKAIDYLFPILMQEQTGEDPAVSLYYGPWCDTALGLGKETLPVGNTPPVRVYKKEIIDP